MSKIPAIQVLFSLLLLFTRKSQTLRPEGPEFGLSSPEAPSEEDPLLGFNAVFSPVPSCLSIVTLVIYVQSLPMLQRLGEYNHMYAPYFAGIEYYVDGTWCDPRRSGDMHQPCFGEELNRSLVPEEVQIVDGLGGGWFMHRAFVDAVLRPRERDTAPVGFLFITDDVLVNIGQLSRTVEASSRSCDMIWRSTKLSICVDPQKGAHRQLQVVKRYQDQARAFYELSDDKFRAQLARNLGSPSIYCMGSQNDFLYMPAVYAKEWARVSGQMTDVGLEFTFPVFASLFGIAPLEDMLVLHTSYLSPGKRADDILQDAIFFPRGLNEFSCWRGGGDHLKIGELLAYHVIHPNKVEGSMKAWQFAQTVNQPPFGRRFGSKEDAAYPFWCP